MIFRLTQKLSSKVRIEERTTLPLSEPAINDWSAQLFSIDRTQLLLLSNSKTLYSCVTSGASIGSGAKFTQRAITAIGEAMHNDGLGNIFEQFIAGDVDTVKFAKSLNRSITGSMNELTQTAVAIVGSGESALAVVSASLNDTWLSSLGNGKEKYEKPMKAMEILASMLVGLSI